MESVAGICICFPPVPGCPAHAPGDYATPQTHHRILIRLLEQQAAILTTQEKIMTQQQSDVDAATAFDTQLDTDIKALTAQVTNGVAAFDAAIAALKAANPDVDTTGLVAAQAVLAGDQPDLDAAVAAMTADPNIAPPASATTEGATPPAAS